LKNSFHPSLGFNFFPMANAAISMAYHRLPQTLCRPQEGRRLVQQWNSAARWPQHIIWARYSTSSTIPTQTQKDQQIRTTERLKELNKLLEDVARTAISTGPRGAIRLAQGIEAVVSVGSEYLLQLYRVFFLCSLLSSLPYHLIPFITVCVHL
jgi:hypothetical protein